ncbi:hypothetical protein IWX90DRAFT_442565 [Phyllosticta citrichinensis]|uniref:Carrier domain-containing protein n=1 Tax=Phyllosticta citrichinensis TaxID=1130410 RepID=A0ABR1XJW0_9PEZI
MHHLTPCSERLVILSSIAKALSLPVEGLDTSKSFTELGGHSLSAVEVQNDCKPLVQKPPTVLSLLVSPSLEDLLPAKTTRGLYPETGPSRSVTPATSDSGFVETSPLNEATDPLDDVSEKYFDAAANATTQWKRDSRTYQQHPTPVISTEQASNPAQAPATDMQVAFIRGGQSTIRYFETWRLEDVVVMKYAWKKVIRAEPIFQTIFDEDKPGSYMMRLSDRPIPWEVTVTFDRQSYRQEVAREEFQSLPTFQFRTVIFRSPDYSRSEATIVLSVHHALLDGFSMERLAEKVRRVATGDQEVKPGKSFLAAAQELDAIKKESEAAAVAFWEKKIGQYGSAASSLGLPRPRKRRAPDRDNEVQADFEHLTDRLQATCRALGVTVASFFHAAWALAQALYTDSDTVVFGSILSGRNLPIDGIGTVIGPLLNSLPLHVEIDEKASTGDFVRRVFRDLAELSCFHWSTPEHGYTRNFEAALSVTRGLQGSSSSSSSSSFHPIRPPRYDFESNIPLSLALDEAAMSLRLVYHPDCYSPETAQDLASCFVSALERLTDSTSVQQCLDSMLTVHMQRRLHVLGNCISGLTTRAAHPEDLMSLFDKAAAANADAAAIEVGELSVSYAELDQLATRVASALAELDVQKDEVVCLHADGSLNWVVGLMGVLKADATICSLDSTLPHDLRSAMFATASSKVFVVGDESQLRFRPKDCEHCLVLDTLTTDTPAAGTTAPRVPRPFAAAYLCFTSGSTGKPKGVLCTQQGLVAFQKDVEVRLHAGPGVRVAQFMSPAFDGSVHEIFSSLCHGGTLVLRSSADPFQVLRVVDSAIMTPSVARTIAAAEFPNLKTVYLVGEQVPETVVQEWAPGRKLYNMYGPTEGTCGATITQLQPGRAVTIGRPNPTSRVYILSRRGCSSRCRLLPPGAIGEICLAGVQISRGYVGASMASETAARFVADDTGCGPPGEMLYRTGDRGYWDDNGEVVCLGRDDRQIKLRGFRLDLDDLEARVLRALPTIRAVALTRAGDALVAMVQPAALDVDTVRAAIKQKLPRQAVPSAIACVDEFPMTRAGKVDLKAIAAKLARG